MALRRAAFAFNHHCIILNPRITYWKFKQSSLFYETSSVPGGTSSTKPCYNEDRVVTFPCLKKLLSEKDIQLFDVRTRGEVDAGKIPGATNIPLDEVQDAFSLSPEDFQKKYNIPKPGLNDENITVHCQSGMRAQAAIKILQDLGFKRTHNFTGGWGEWQNAMEADMAAGNQ